MYMRIYAEKYTWHPNNLSPTTLRVSHPKKYFIVLQKFSPQSCLFSAPLFCQEVEYITCLNVLIYFYLLKPIIDQDWLSFSIVAPYGSLQVPPR